MVPSEKTRGKGHEYEMLGFLIAHQKKLLRVRCWIDSLLPREAVEAPWRHKKPPEYDPGQSALGGCLRRGLGCRSSPEVAFNLSCSVPLCVLHIDPVLGVLRGARKTK